MKESAIIYSRVSTEDQDNQRQINELEQYALYKKYALEKVFEEKITGFSKAKTRGEFTKVLEFIDKNKTKHLLVWELSRLGRSMVDVINTIQMLSEKGINVYCKKENINTLDSDGKQNLMTNIIISILSGFAEMERETIKARSKSGIRANVARGGIGTGGVKAYGYKNENGMLVIDQEEAVIVKEIYEKYLNGLGTQQLAAYLNNKGIPTRYNKEYGQKEVSTKTGIKRKGEDYVWRDGTIYSILTNSIYYGERKLKGEIFKIDPIINKSIFDQVQSLLSQKANKIAGNTFDNPFKDLIKCGKCGQSYFLHKRADGRDNAYKCLSSRLTKKKYGDQYCGNPAVNYDKLIDSVYVIAQSLINSDLISKKPEYLAVLERNIENKTIERDNAVKEISDLEKQADKLIRLNLSGNLTEKQFTKFNSEITDKLATLNERLIAVEGDLLDLRKRKEPTTEFAYGKESLGDYLKEAVEYIKIYEADIDKFKNVYPEKLNAVILVQIKGRLEWEDGTPVLYHFLIGRRSRIVSLIDLKEDAHLLDNIKTSNYKITSSTLIDDMKVFPGIQNHLLKKPGEPHVPKLWDGKGQIIGEFEFKEGQYRKKK